ncbi:MAG: hypothetical protein JNK79_05025 [Chitinophagaceae bacterium]|nr:hypothetical protein [Chitinophagaceae bacterium]
MKIVSLIAALICFQFTYSQTLPNFEEVSLKQASDYKPAEVTVLTAANYILSTPVKEDDLDRKMAFAFILRWMTGTPDYSFEVDETAAKISKGNNEMIGLYMAAMAKYGIENPANAKDKQLVRDNALEMVIDYCKKPENNIKMTKGLKKYAEERSKK